MNNLILNLDSHCKTVFFFFSDIHTNMIFQPKNII